MKRLMKIMFLAVVTSMLLAACGVASDLDDAVEYGPGEDVQSDQQDEISLPAGASISAVTISEAGIMVMESFPVLLPAICARISPFLSSGVRTLARMRLRTSSSRIPCLTSFTGGMIKPSWKISEARGMDPGDIPPTSEW